MRARLCSNVKPVCSVVCVLLVFINNGDDKEEEDIIGDSDVGKALAMLRGR